MSLDKFTPVTVECNWFVEVIGYKVDLLISQLVACTLTRWHDLTLAIEMVRGKRQLRLVFSCSVV